MLEYTSLDDTVIRVGENAKENDELTLMSAPKYCKNLSQMLGNNLVRCHAVLINP